MTLYFVIGYIAFLALYLLAIIGLGFYERQYTIPGDPLHRWTRIIQWVAGGIAILSFFVFIAFMRTL